MQNPSWGIVATVNEPLPLIASFVAHYLDIGASEIHLFFDAPFDEIQDAIGHLPQVKTYFTDNAFYKSVGRRSFKHLNLKQMVNANHAYATTEVDWLLLLDADEFLESDDFAAFLAQQPENVGAVRLINQERAYRKGMPIQGIFDGVGIEHNKFTKRWVRSSLDAENEAFLINGVLGHCAGKSVVRTGYDAEMGIHSPRFIKGADVVWKPGVLLHHFDGMTPLHWAAKLLRYARKNMFVDGREKRTALNRYNQVAFLKEHGVTPQAALTLHERLRVLPGNNIGLRERFGLVHNIGIDPGAAIKRWLPHLDIDLSAEHFDALLAERDPHFAEWLYATQHAA